MVWLVSQMWILLGGAALLGLLLGWGVRGFLLIGRVRRAEVERDVLATELGQAKTEIEDLYAASRNQAQPAASLGPDEAVMRAKLEEHQAKLASLTEELQRSKEELAALKAEGNGAGTAAAAGAAVAGAVAAAALSEGEDERAHAETPLDSGLDMDQAGLEWRNRYLESRVRRLEQQVQEAGTLNVAAEPADASAFALAAPQADGATPEDGVDATALAKMRWQNDYLRQRVDFLEEKVSVLPAGTAAGMMAVAANGETVEEELARLRWRNRYLEGRLAYLEEDAPAPASVEGVLARSTEASLAASAGEAAAEAAAPEAVDREAGTEPAADATSQVAEFAAEEEAGAASTSGSETEPALVQTEAAEGEQGSDDTPGDELTAPAPEAEAPVAAEEMASEGQPDAEPDPTVQTAEPAEAAEVDEPAGEAGSSGSDEAASPAVMEQPPFLDKPAGYQGDDLTAIDGVGPRIQDVLNELGIFHYAQIAAWTPENEAWIDDYLSFSGRVSREAWVVQAQALAGDQPDEA